MLLVCNFYFVIVINGLFTISLNAVQNDMETNGYVRLEYPKVIIYKLCHIVQRKCLLNITILCVWKNKSSLYIYISVKINAILSNKLPVKSREVSKDLNHFSFSKFYTKK